MMQIRARCASRLLASPHLPQLPLVPLAPESIQPKISRCCRSVASVATPARQCIRRVLNEQQRWRAIAPFESVVCGAIDHSLHMPFATANTDDSATKSNHRTLQSAALQLERRALQFPSCGNTQRAFAAHFVDEGIRDDLQ
jgi:hypothetical protein